MKLITIIPAYNEEKAIIKVVRESLKYSEVLVIDDGSEDDTALLAKNAGAIVISHPHNLGKGAALKTGIKYAQNHDYGTMVFIDGDGQHDPHLIPLLSSKVNGNDLVIGSRFKEGSPQYMPIQRRISNRFTTFIISKLTGYTLTDSQSGFRALSSTAGNIFLNIGYNDYIFESEMLYMAYKNNLQLEEVNIPCYYGEEKSYVTSKHALKYLFFVIKRILRKFKRRVFS
ncbi:glycosyltransferase family 2 protein [Methanobacterium alkalithermotolerans]|uniref:Glycosyltransferase family 2 protein n=1 Tax=Methanobacterium alkalithermotolerans TaxID=2731220 RepID=A0A8T8K8Y9_9EURY|nr:glycosyltransferase family 2 protein [Methanobacterium alkalithermotolerans]QUH23573.1 glycosyltransferase family 2 protein [Methanobacterium alkalithermotolerans]RJS48027.1 MAG: dolichyl-phosphate mannose synthase [Methanobacterium sp.]